MKRAKFDRRGSLALAAEAVGAEFEIVEATGFEVRGGVAIVDLSGPLTHHATPGSPWDSYDGIRARFVEAVASPARTLILRIDSPGGDVAGCFELSRDMRDMAAKAGKKLVTYADGMAASAGYALACAGSEIWTSSAGAVGSIGVCHMLVDTTAADRAMGLAFAVITSGARKADGNPHVAISDETLGVYQATVNSLAELFFALVASARPISSESVRGYEAGMFHGAAAQVAGLVDGVCTFEQLLEMVSGPGAMAQAVAETTMKLTEIKAALVKAAEGDGDEAAEAKKMLAALFGEEKKDDEKAKAEGEPEKKDDEKAKAEGEPEKKDDEKKDEEAKASAAALARVGVVERELAGMKALAQSQERTAILAARTDLTEGQVKLLSAQPLEQMKRTLAAFPAATTTTALTGVRNKVPTAGSNQSSANDLRTATTLSAHSEMLDRQMGFTKPGPAITKEGDRLVCRTMTPTQAREHLKKIEARDAAQEAVK